MTTIVTHNGHFHTDDLLAVGALLLKYPDAEVIRTRDEAVIARADVAVDVGGEYDPERMRFDHHQTEGAGTRPDGVPYASIGLVWKAFGAELAGGEEEAKILEEKMIISVDATDNGIDMYISKFDDATPYTLGDYFESFVDSAETMEDLDRNFFKALPLAKELLEREIRTAKKKAADWRKVREIYEASPDKRIILLPLHVSWRQPLIPTEATYVIYPRANGTWSAQAVNETHRTYKVKKPFPASWAGLNNGDLARISGVPGSVFCHRNGFLTVAQTREGALKLAQIALNS